jgi:hypothetical protein
VIDVKQLNRYLGVFSHEPVSLTFVITLLLKRELNLLNDRRPKAEADRLGSCAELGTSSIRLNRLIMGYAGDR